MSASVKLDKEKFLRKLAQSGRKMGSYIRLELGNGKEKRFHFGFNDICIAHSNNAKR